MALCAFGRFNFEPFPHRDDFGVLPYGPGMCMMCVYVCVCVSCDIKLLSKCFLNVITTRHCNVFKMGFCLFVCFVLFCLLKTFIKRFNLLLLLLGTGMKCLGRAPVM